MHCVQHDFKYFIFCFFKGTATAADLTGTYGKSHAQVNFVTVTSMIGVLLDYILSINSHHKLHQINTFIR